MSGRRVEHINFAVGPVMMEEDILQIGANQIPYFRTVMFSELMKENESILKDLFEASADSRVIFLATSGTGAMESSVMNCFTPKDKVLIINGGGFGERFVQICKIHQIPYKEVKLHAGQALTMEHLVQYGGAEFTGLLVNMHETSTGVLYDMDLIGQFCQENNLFLVVDAVSSFLADAVHMERWNANVMFTASQKALALPPGLAAVVLDQVAVNRINSIQCASLYMDYKLYLTDGLRGQTPFTPAVSILLQLNSRLRGIQLIGIHAEIARVQQVAADFRKKIKKMPFKIASESLSNAVTPLEPLGKLNAYQIFEYLENHYKIWICPNGGNLRETLFRVGHIGALTIEDNDRLMEAFHNMKAQGIL